MATSGKHGHASALDDSAQNPHSRHCFVAMPFGRTAEEQRWHRGWYHEVIRPTVEAAGYEAVLSVAEDKPTPIDTEMRTHLACDGMVVADLGGMTAEDEPNPNVMYELGLRHAFNKPIVIMAWKGQRLPFDIHRQRVAASDRSGFDSLQTNRDRLRRHLRAATKGAFFRPMDEVGRYARLEVATGENGDPRSRPEESLQDQMRSSWVRIVVLQRLGEGAGEAQLSLSELCAQLETTARKSVYEALVSLESVGLVSKVKQSKRAFWKISAQGRDTLEGVTSSAGTRLGLITT